MRKSLVEKPKLHIISIVLICVLCIVTCVIYYLDIKNILYNNLLKTSLITSEHNTKAIVSWYKFYYSAKNSEELRNLHNYYSYILEKDVNLKRFLIINNKSEIFFDSEELVKGWYDYSVMGVREVYYENLQKNQLVVNFRVKDGKKYIEVISPYIDHNSRHIYSVLYYFSTKPMDTILFSNLIKMILLSLGLIIIISVIISVFSRKVRISD